jgi:hypothetical protein
MGKDTGIQLKNDLTPEINVVRDSSGLITSGFTVGNTLYQNQYMILVAQKGEFKENPTLGCGISDIANDDNFNQWQKDIRDEFAKDDMTVSTLSLSSEGMSLTAKYK